MKAGNLVRLSAYGENLKMFRWLSGKVGIVTDTDPLSDDYSVKWFTKNGPMPYGHLRKDLKKVN